jgi:hypothetical protein
LTTSRRDERWKARRLIGVCRSVRLVSKRLILGFERDILVWEMLLCFGEERWESRDYIISSEAGVVRLVYCVSMGFVW